LRWTSVQHSAWDECSRQETIHTRQQTWSCGFSYTRSIKL